MHVIKVRNVSEALPAGLSYLLRSGSREESRVGEVITAPGPVTTLYTAPCECVLTNPLRDANPFFHVMEALWMLAGRQDAAFLNRYIKDFGLRFAEADGDIYGAYGARWRHWFGYDQLDTLVANLTRNPGTRQGVLQMWDGETDLIADVKDRPCNMSAVFRLRGETNTLSMTVYNRSNDAIMGAYGANAVHFNFLHQYVAARAGVTVGYYYQVSNDFHAYVADLEKLAARSQSPLFQPGPDFLKALTTMYIGPHQRLVANPTTFDQELKVFLFSLEAGTYDEKYPYRNPFLSRTALPMAQAHQAFKVRDIKLALKYADGIFAPDWRTASIEWLQRRNQK